MESTVNRLFRGPWAAFFAKQGVYDTWGFKKEDFAEASLFLFF